MKTKSFLIAALMVGSFAGYAQEVEIDDMYFTSKDRAVLNATKPLPTIKSNDEFDAIQTKTSSINPTDSYSGRGTNPEYTSQTAVKPIGSKANSGYFSNNYQPNPINQMVAYQPTGLNNLYNYNRFGGYGNNNFGMNSFCGNGFNNFYSPFSSGFGMGLSPYYQMGMNSGFGWGGYSSFGMGNGFFGNPYSNFYGNNFYGNGFNSFNNGFGGNYFPTSVIVINYSNDGNNGYVRGRRPERGGSDTYYDGNRSRVAAASNSNGGNSRGREANQYYDRSWRNSVPQDNQSQRRSYFNNSNAGNNGGNTRSSWDGSNGQSSFGNARSSFNSGGLDGGSRSSGFSGGGGNSGGGGGSSSGGGGGGRSRN